MNFALIANLLEAYKEKSLLKSSEFHAVVLAGVGLALKQWAPGVSPELSSHIGPVVDAAVTYAALRVASKAAKPAAAVVTKADPGTGSNS